MRSPRTFARGPLALVCAMVLALTLGAPSHAGTAHVRGNNQRWHPRLLEITTGTRVIWRAVDTTHTVTAYSANWSKDTTIAAGERTRFTFRNAGRFRYRCMIHSTLVGGVCSGMCGRVVVT